MMRTIGFLSGVCLTIAAFLLAAHPWERQPAETVAETPSTPAPEELSKAAAAVTEQAVTEQVDMGPPANASAPAVPAPRAAGSSDSPTPSGNNASAPEPVEPPDTQAATPVAASDGEDSGERGRFLFWSPFRSAWAAEGFARQLSSATQVPVEVIEAGPGKYRVAFSYQDDIERLARITRIETITGLKLE
jgi:hypothetical protein